MTVAKNYLAQAELDELNRIVSMYLDFAEDRARRQTPMHMAEWVTRLDAFLEFNERNILTHAGKVSHPLAEEHAHAQFAHYDAERRQLEASQPSDFDKIVDEVKRLEQHTPPKRKPSSPGRKKKKDD